MSATRVLGRVSVPVMAFVVAIGMLFGSAGQAVAAPQPVAQSPEQAKVVELQAEYKAKASPEDYRKAVETYDRLVAGKPDPVEQPASVCVSIPKWAIVGYAWYVIVAGGATAAVGGFLDGTIVGLPAGAVLNAVGIGATVTGSGLLYWTDHTSWPKRVCV
ncbi:hypothetical protein E4J66_06905 [Actinomyces viscosus]|uniref:hypothetical protein n=1 Tax=Actinomyces viscosus TaxID=1656 RepID=UPI000F822ACE|nr:hypothetical protein [Actinomyces viscosus]TFH52657.1 hypothetical protein E4J66_06905 [Actinomyces viscosus]